MWVWGRRAAQSSALGPGAGPGCLEPLWAPPGSAWPVGADAEWPLPPRPTPTPRRHIQCHVSRSTPGAAVGGGHWVKGHPCRMQWVVDLSPVKAGSPVPGSPSGLEWLLLPTRTHCPDSWASFCAPVCPHPNTPLFLHILPLLNDRDEVTRSSTTTARPLAGEGKLGLFQGLAGCVTLSRSLALSEPLLPGL